MYLLQMKKDIACEGKMEITLIRFVEPSTVQKLGFLCFQAQNDVLIQ